MKFARSALLAAALLVPAVAFAAIGVNKTFNPINVSAGQSSTLTVILINNNPAAATAATFTDTLPGTVVIATPANASTTCVGGTVTATSGNGSFSFSGGTIPAAVGLVAGQCTVQVDVDSLTAGVFINTIPANAVTSSQGANAQAASATLTVAALRPVTGAKAFAPANLHGGGTPSTVTMTLTNPNGVALTAAAFTDTLPVASLAVAPVPNASTTCGAGTVTTTANSASLSGGTIPANGSCIVRFDVVAVNPNVFVDANVTNSILINALTTAQGVSNSAFSANVRLQTGARVEKSFAPSPITTGGTSTLTVTVRNFNATPLSGIAFTDTLPGTMRVAAPVTTATTCASLAFTPVPIAGDAFFTVSGGTLLGAPAAVGNTLCTVTIDVTATNAGLNPVTLTNTVPAGNFGGVAFSSAGANLTVNAVTSVGGSKSFSPAAILQGQTSTLTITLTNSAAVAATITAFTDLLTTLGATPQFTVAAVPPAVTSCGGVVNAAPGVTTITLGAGNSIPATGSCTITVPVQASATASTGARTNTIAQGALQTDQGRTQTTITGALTVNPVLTVAKSFAPATVAAGADTRLTITLTRAGGASALSGLAFTDNLPALYVVSATPNLVNNCGGVVTAAGGSVSLAGGSLAGGAAATSCTILVNITTPAGAGAPTNTIAAGAVTSIEGFINPAAANAVITRVVTNVTLNKSFSPATVLVGGVSQLTINVLNTNANALALTATALTDTLPVGMVIATPPAATNTCGGVLTAVAGAGTVTLTNGSIAANASCRIQVNVVANASGNLINTLGAGAFTSAQGVTNPLPAQATLAATGSADLAVTKTDGVGSAVPGTTTTYTIVATNNGPNVVAGAGVVDTPPAGMSFTSWTCVASAGSACGNPSGSGPINELVTLIVNGTATFTVTAAIAPTATGTITNTATVIVPGTVIDTVPGNNTASDIDTLTPVADLSIVKSGPASVNALGAITYTLTIANAGPSSANGATFSDNVPAGVTGIAASCGSPLGGAVCPGSVGVVGNLVSGSVPTLPSGGSVVITITGTAPTSGTLANTANVAAPVGATDPNLPNNTSTVNTTVNPIADVAIVKSGPATVNAASTITYTLTISNLGPSSANGATFSDNVPAGVTGVAAGCGGALGGAVCPGSVGVAGNLVSGAIPTLPPGGSVVITITGTAPASGTLSNTATVAAPVGTTDPNLPNNTSATVSTTVNPLADLAIVKVGPANVNAAGTITYTLTISNAGPSSADGATFADAVPVGITGVAASCGGALGGAVCGAVNVAGNSVTGIVTTLPKNSSVVITITGTAPASGTLANTANVAAPVGATDPNLPNNTSTVNTTVNPIADLAIVKSGPATVNAAAAITYTLTISNAGPSSADGTTFADAVPAGITGVAASCGSALGGAVCGAVNVAGNNVTGAITTLPLGGSVVITITGTSPASGTLSNTATVAAPVGTTDPILPNNTSGTVTTTVNPIADLAIVKSGPASVNAAGTITYTLTISNAGPSSADGATFADAVPAGITGVAASCGGALGGAVCGAVNVAGNNVTGTVTTLPLGGSVVITITGTAPASGSLANTATVAAPVGTIDPNLPNNTSTVNTTVNPIADLAIVKSGPATVNAAAAITYPLTISNAGPSSADGTTFADAVPAGITGVAASCGGAAGGAICGAVNVAGNNVTGTVNTLPKNGSVVITITGTAPSNAATLNNTATVAAPAGTTDPNLPNNTATVSTTVNPVADLSVTKTDGVSSVNAGGSTVYTIVVSNAGPSIADGAIFKDPAVANLTVTGVTCGSASGGAACPTVPNTTVVLMQGTGIVVRTLPAGGGVTFTVNGNVPSSATGSITNIATISAPAGVTDTVPGNNSATDLDTITLSADLSITKTDGVISVVPGAATTYTIVVTNNGPSNVVGATVTDVMPAAIATDTFTAVGSGGASGFTASSSGNISDLVDLPAGATVTYTVVANVASNATGTLANTATVAAPTGVTDSVPGNNSSTDTDTLTPQVTLFVAKDDGSATYTPGGTATYTVTITDTGVSDAADVTVADLLPPGLTLTANVSCTANGSASCGLVTGSIGGISFGTTVARIGAGSGNSLVFNVPVAFASGMVTNPLVNTATATDIATGATASGTDTDNLATQVTLAVVKTDGSSTYTPGGTATYTVTITHGGLSDATNVTVNDPLPAGVTLTANASCVAIGAASCGIVTGLTGQSIFGTTGGQIAAGAGNSLVFTAPVAFAAGMATDPLDNTATAVDVLSGATGAGTDSDTRAALVTLAVSKNDSSATYTPGGGATYLVGVTNTGASDALNVTVGDLLPIGVLLSGNVTCAVTGSANCGTVTGSAGQSSFAAVGARINAGAANSLTFTVPVSFASNLADNPLTNTATANDLASGATGSASDNDTLAAQADLSITKTDGVTTVVPGTTTTYTIIVANSGPSDVIGATVNDVLPAAITSDTFTATGTGGASGFTAVGSGNISDTVNLPAGSTITYTLVANISGSASGNLTNTATVAAPAGVTETNPANNSATDTNTLTAQADLSITKSDGVISVVPGTTTTYTIVVANGGPSAVVGATVSDVLPAAITSDTFTATGTGGASGFTASGSGNINDTVNLPAGSTITYTLVATISASASGSLVNTATVTAPAGVTETNPGNNSATDTDTLTPQADLAITKTDGVTSVAQSGVATYTIVVTNNGPSAVLGATVSDPMPAAIVSDTFTAIGSGGASGFTASGSGNINDTVNLPAGSTITYTVVAIVSASAIGVLVNTAIVIAPGGVTDTNPGNNSATDTDTITLTPVADLAITKTDGGATYTPGGAVTYAIVVSNAGPAGVIGATVVDALPTAIMGANWTCVGAGGGTCPPSGSGNINVSVNLPAGASVTFTLTGTIAANATGNLVNTATVSAPAGTTDPNPGNNSATDTDTPTAMAGLAITKTDGSASYTPGGTGTYTITVTNNGPSNANSVTITDNMPAGVTLTGNATCVATGAATCGTVTGSTGGSAISATGATIAAGAGNSLVFTLPVRFANGMTTNPLVNIATATDLASQSVASASDSNVLVAGPSNPIPVDNRWALALLAGFILLAAWRQSRGASLRKRM